MSLHLDWGFRRGIGLRQACCQDLLPHEQDKEPAGLEDPDQYQDFERALRRLKTKTQVLRTTSMDV